MTILITIAVYLILSTFSRFTARRSSNATFYLADKCSPWYMVAFGMVGRIHLGRNFYIGTRHGSEYGYDISADVSWLYLGLFSCGIYSASDLL